MTVPAAAADHTTSIPAVATVLGGQPCWIHGTGAARAVLLCGAQGHEGLASHHAWHVLADMLAGAGLMAVRFDYPGEGDALDLADDADPISAAIDAIGRVYDAVAAMPGVASVSVTGLRLGGLLAQRALVGRPIQRLALLAPVDSGRAYIRALTAQARLSTGGGETDGSTLVVNGFRLPAAGATTLAGLALDPSAPDCPILLAGGAERAVITGALRIGFDDYEAMLAPTEMTPPLITFRTVTKWLAQDAAPAMSVERTFPPAVLALDHGREERLRFGPDLRLAGIYCRPSAPAAGRPCVLFTNAGTNPHAGWARMSVDHARAMAVEGVASLRFDLSGLGDSAVAWQSPRRSVYSPAHPDDLTAAIDLAKASGAETIVVAGLCSAGHLALHGAAQDRRINAVLAANVLKFLWTADDDLDRYEAQALQSAAQYGARVGSGQAWRRVLSGEVSPARVLRVAGMLAGRVLRQRLDKIGVSFHLGAESRQVRALVRAVTARGCAVTLLNSVGDASIDEAERQFGSNFSGIRGWPGVSVASLGPSDHELSAKKARDLFYEAIKRRALGI